MLRLSVNYEPDDITGQEPANWTQCVAKQHVVTSSTSAHNIVPCNFVPVQIDVHKGRCLVGVKNRVITYYAYALRIQATSAWAWAWAYRPQGHGHCQGQGLWLWQIFVLFAKQVILEMMITKVLNTTRHIDLKTCRRKIVR